MSAFEACNNRRKARAAQRKLDVGEQESEDSDCILMTHLAHNAYHEQQRSDKEKETTSSPPTSGDAQVEEDEEAKALRKEKEEAERVRIEELATQRKLVEGERERGTDFH